MKGFSEMCVGLETNYILENARIQIEFNRKGEFLAFSDRCIGRNYIINHDSLYKPLFRLCCVEIESGHVLPGDIELSAASAERKQITRHDNELSLVYDKIGGFDINVVCTVVLESDVDTSKWRIQVFNKSGMAIKYIQYPVLHVPFQLGESAEDDKILLPKEDGCLLGNPSLSSWQGNREDCWFNQRYDYPHEGRETPCGLSAQLLAYYDHEGGLYIAAHDGEGNRKKLGPIWERREDIQYFDFTPVHCMSEVANNDFICSYDTVLGCFTGDWQAAADIYKKWAITQKWCSKRIAERSDIPEWIKEGAFFFNFRLRYQEDGVEFLERVPKYLERWKAKLNIPMVAMMCGWEKVGEWVGPDYFPPYGREKFKRMCERIKGQGIRPFPFGLSGLKLPIRKLINQDWPQPELAIDYNNRKAFREQYQPYAAKNADGTFVTDAKIQSWDGLHGYACVATPQARKQIYGAAMELVKNYGAQICQADQVFGGGAPACYEISHGHAPGRGKWQTEALQGIYEDVRRDGKLKDPDFAFSQEFQSELYLQHLDIYHCRNYDQPRGLVAVPLFSYLYHEYIPSYGGDWSSFLEDNTSGVHYFAYNFVYGNLPAGCPQTMWKMLRNAAPEESDPSIMKMAQNTCILFQKFTRHLVMGEMLRTSSLPVPMIAVKFIGINFSGWTKKELQVPSVLHCLWRSPEGKIALALANISGDVQEFTLNAELLEALKGTQKLLLTRNNDPAVDLAPGLTHTGEVLVRLRPLDAAILEFVE